MAHVSHTLTSGQSLSVGYVGTPIISTTSEATNAKKADGTTMSALTVSTVQRPDASMGYRIAQAHPTLTIAMSTHGVAGEAIANLAKGGLTGAYEAAITRVTDMYAGRISAGDTYDVRAFHWIQGEADQLNGTPHDVYLAALIEMYADLLADVAGILGTPQAFPFLISQVATWARNAPPARIGLAQLEAARTVEGMYLVGPQYQLPYNADNVHLTAPGYYYLGELHARAQNAVLGDGDWKPVMPLSYVIDDDAITITYHVPEPPLVWDTTAIAAQVNKGFCLVGTAAEIVSVDIIGPETVVITTDQPVTEATARVGYGVSTGSYAGLGNLRDSETAVSVYDGVALPNWAVHSFDLVLADAYPTTYYVSESLMLAGDGLHAVTIDPDL